MILASLKGSFIHTLELKEQILLDNTALSVKLMSSPDDFGFDILDMDIYFHANILSRMG